MNNLIPQPKLIELLCGITKMDRVVAEKFIEGFTATVSEILAANDSVKIKGFGQFHIVKGDGAQRVMFVPDKDISEAINAPFACFEPVELAPGLTAESLEASVKEELAEDKSHDDAAAPESATEAPTDTQMPVEEETSETEDAVEEETSELEAAVEEETSELEAAMEEETTETETAIEEETTDTETAIEEENPEPEAEVKEEASETEVTVEKDTPESDGDKDTEASEPEEPADNEEIQKIKYSLEDLPTEEEAPTSGKTSEKGISFDDVPPVEDASDSDESVSEDEELLVENAPDIEESVIEEQEPPAEANADSSEPPVYEEELVERYKYEEQIVNALRTEISTNSQQEPFETPQELQNIEAEPTHEPEEEEEPAPMTPTPLESADTQEPTAAEKEDDLTTQNVESEPIIIPEATAEEEATIEPEAAEEEEAAYSPETPAEEETTIVPETTVEEVPRVEETAKQPMSLEEERPQERQHESQPKPWFWIAITYVGGMAIGFVLGFFGHDYLGTAIKNTDKDASAISTDDAGSPDASPSGPELDLSDAEEGVIEPSDNTDSQENAEAAEDEAENEATTTGPAPEPAPEPQETPKSTEPVYDTVKVGRYLSTMAKEHYGNKVYWVYIYLENQDKIKNPNNVMIGTKLLIPPKEKYDVSATDEEANLKAANAKQAEIYRKFSH